MKPRMERLVLVLGVIAWALTPAFSAPPLSPANTEDPLWVDILGQFKSIQCVEADFEEVKEWEALSKPLHSSGRLSFFPEEGMYVRWFEPLPMEMVITRGWIAQKDEKGSTLRLPRARGRSWGAIVDVMLSLLNGEGRLIRRHFDSRLEGTSTRWSLTLTPLPSSPLKKGVALLSLHGHGPLIDEMEMITSSPRCRVVTRYLHHRVWGQGFAEELPVPSFPHWEFRK